MRGLRVVLVFFLMGFGPNPCHSASDYAGLIEEFLSIVKRGPTVSDSQRFDGPESELHFEWMVCRERNWPPEDFNEKCVAFTKSRAADAANQPSLHLSWLRSKLPAYKDIRVLNVEDIVLGEYACKRIVTRLDDVEVVFGHDTRKGPYGYLFILSIDGKSPDALLEEDVSKGFTPSIYLKNILEP